MDTTSTAQIASAAAGRRHVFLRDLTLYASIGIHPGEQLARQRVRVNIDLAVADPGSRPGAAPVGADDLSRVVDYEAIATRVRGIVAGGHVRLVETLAEMLAAAALEDPRVEFVRVRIEKLDIFPDARSVGVEIERLRP